MFWFLMSMQVLCLTTISGLVVFGCTQKKQPNTNISAPPVNIRPNKPQEQFGQKKVPAIYAKNKPHKNTRFPASTDSKGGVGKSKNFTGGEQAVFDKTNKIESPSNRKVEKKPKDEEKDVVDSERDQKPTPATPVPSNDQNKLTVGRLPNKNGYDELNPNALVKSEEGGHKSTYKDNKDGGYDNLDPNQVDAQNLIVPEDARAKSEHVDVPQPAPQKPTPVVQVDVKVPTARKRAALANRLNSSFETMRSESPDWQNPFTIHNINPPNYRHPQAGCFRCTKCEEFYKTAKKRNNHEVSVHNFHRSERYSLREIEAEYEHETVEGSASTSRLSVPMAVVATQKTKRMGRENMPSQLQATPRDDERISSDRLFPSSSTSTSNSAPSSSFTFSPNTPTILNALKEPLKSIFYDFDRGGEFEQTIVEEWKKKSECKLLIIRVTEFKLTEPFGLDSPIYEANMMREPKKFSKFRTLILCYSKTDGGEEARILTSEMNPHITFRELLADILAPLGRCLVIADSNDRKPLNHFI
ncbi:hypothetical protein M3Y94_01066800 [Aphelenchoides besseyi]|nr:hypothetical protein M3Y94_01066800 [Aphelenchoides besseyi]